MKKIISILLSIVLIMIISGCNIEPNYTNGKSVGNEVSITFPYDSLAMKVGDKKNVKINCSSNLNDIDYNIYSNNSTIATVNKTSDGVAIQAYKVGSTTINLSSKYGSDKLIVLVENTSISLSKSNYTAYMSLISSYSGNNVSVKIIPINSNYQLLFSATVSIIVYGTYSYYPTASRWVGQNPNTQFGNASKIVSMSNSNMYIVEDLTQEIKNKCPGYQFVSFKISSVSVNITVINGTVKY